MDAFGASKFAFHHVLVQSGRSTAALLLDKVGTYAGDIQEVPFAILSPFYDAAVRSLKARHSFRSPAGRPACTYWRYLEAKRLRYGGGRTTVVDKQGVAPYWNSNMDRQEPVAAL